MNFAWPDFRIDANRAPATRGRRRVALRIAVRTAGICGAGIAAQVPPSLLVGWPIDASDVLLIILGAAGAEGVVGLGVALTLEALTLLGRWPAWQRHLLLLAGLAASASSAFVSLGVDGPARVGLRLGLISSMDALDLHYLWLNSVLASVSAAYLLQHRGSLEAEQRSAELAAQAQQARRRIRIAREAAQAAQLDPQVLFDCLGLARREYLRDPAAADSLLDGLIRFLRKTLAGTGTTRSTLGRELDLVENYAAIFAPMNFAPMSAAPPGPAPPGGCAVEVAAEPDLRRIEVSPGLLLPLVQSWLAACADRPSPGQRLLLSAERSLSSERMAMPRLTLHLRGPDLPIASALDDCRARLADLYGPQSSLAVEKNAADGTLCLTLSLTEQAPDES